VRSPGYELGQIAGRELIARLETGRFAQRAIKVPVELILGETT
jgi:DNA-binding LacI/PurR family transcriptional regulator